MEVLQGIKFMMHNCWKFFMINVPGFRFNFGELFLGLTLARMSLGYIQTMIGVAPSPMTDREATYISGSISERRRRPIGFGR